MIAGRLAASVAQRHVRYLTPVPPAAATGRVARVYSQVADEFLIVVPPALLHSPAPPVLAAYWMLVREPLVAAGEVDRLAKEAVAAAVSVANTCPYCVDMHGIGVSELSTMDDAEAVTGDRVGDVTDARVRALTAWARAAHLPGCGSPFPESPFPESHRAELVGVVVAFHYLTRMVNVFLNGTLLPPRLGPAGRRRFVRGVGRLLAPTLRSRPDPGRSVPLLPDAPLPTSAAWASGAGAVATAVARAYAAFEAAGVRSVPAPVRELVSARLQCWRGEEPGLGPQWCDGLVAGLSGAERAAARLALFTAFASYRVDERMVGEFRRWYPQDRTLVETTAWASFAAARRVGAWHAPASVRPPGPQSERTAPTEAAAG